MRIARPPITYRIAILVWVALGTGLLAGCAVGRLLPFGSGEDVHFRHRELGYEIAYPGVLGEPGWTTERLDEADLIVRHPEGSLWALASTCRGSAAGLRLLAGELARATGGAPRGGSVDVQQAGLSGLAQRLEREDSGLRLQIKTVTLRGARCTYDWILIAPSEARFAELEPRFDQWWQSFEPGPTESPVEEASSGETPS